MRVYLDNAATTPLDPAVFEEMKPYLLDHFGNPSSIHTHGREVRSAIERSRKKIADLLNTSPGEIFFTSGGTEADNTALICSVESAGIKRIITSTIEHHAVLHTAQLLEKQGKVKVEYVLLDDQGDIDLKDLERLIGDGENTMVSLMHGNNEIATLNDLEAIGELCREKGALFHSDTVQTVGHFKHDLEQLPIDFIVGSAHKFHGPKGIGFLYIHHQQKIPPLIHGGSQERNMRGGTENVTGIIGLAKALELSYSEMSDHKKHIENLKSRMIGRLKEIPGITFNGTSDQLDKSLYTVLNVSLPESDTNDMLLFNLDINGISASGGSACTSGSNIGSHVLSALGVSSRRGAIRFSFCRYNTQDEVDFTVEKLQEVLAVGA